MKIFQPKRKKKKHGSNIFEINRRNKKSILIELVMKINIIFIVNDENYSQDENASIVGKTRENRLGWFGYEMKRYSQ